MAPKRFLQLAVLLIASPAAAQVGDFVPEPETDYPSTLPANTSPEAERPRTIHRNFAADTSNNAAPGLTLEESARDAEITLNAERAVLLWDEVVAVCPPDSPFGPCSAALLSRLEEIPAEDRDTALIRADSALSYEDIVQLMDVITRAGYDHIAFATVASDGESP
ncbi:MAG: hypothetical protein KC561_00030 [Myxococcales bacterium]|nr:hypothetical protein [Myxococcales bacterium]